MKENIFSKRIWDDHNYDEMNWHDCKIYGIAFNDQHFELAFDIDYIIKWIDPNATEKYYQFFVAPATLVFRNVYDIQTSFYSVDVRIENVVRSNPVTPKNRQAEGELEYDWEIEIEGGGINFKSTGYRQYIRKQPLLLDKQVIGLLQRGGVSFATV